MGKCKVSLTLSTEAASCDGMHIAPAVCQDKQFIGLSLNTAHVESKKRDMTVGLHNSQREGINRK